MDEDRRTQYLVHRILSGTLIFKREGRTLELRSPSLELKYMSDVLYKHNYEQNIYEFILREDIRPLLLKAGYVTPLHDDDVKRIKKKVDNLKPKAASSLFGNEIDAELQGEVDAAAAVIAGEDPRAVEYNSEAEAEVDTESQSEE